VDIKKIFGTRITDTHPDITMNTKRIFIQQVEYKETNTRILSIPLTFLHLTIFISHLKFSQMQFKLSNIYLC